MHANKVRYNTIGIFMACLGGSNDSSVRLLRAQILNQILHQIVCEQAKGKKNQTKFAVRAESCEKQRQKQLRGNQSLQTQEHFRIDFHISRLPRQRNHEKRWRKRGQSNSKSAYSAKSLAR